MKNHGISLIEVMICVAIVAIMLVIAFPVINGDTQTINSQNQELSSVYTANGVIQTRCINGYLFVVGGNGEARQVMDELGHGAPCKQPQSE